jgi:tetratricopeptide (TPR) repeat protein
MANMKKIMFNSLILGSLVFLFPACSKFTEITPKGSNILNRVSDLDLLLNFNYSYNSNVRDTSLAGRTTAGTAFQPNSDAGVLVNDIYPFVTNVTNLIALHSITLPYALTTYDETIDRKTLATTDAKYEKMYFIINNVCNVVLANADNASGDRVKAAQLKAEAYILRAYFHYLLVNFYAKAYNPATAASDGGIPYVKEDNLISVPNKKSTVAEVYGNIVADLNAGLALNSLPSTPANNMRVGLGFAYAVKAQILMAMRNYTDALTAANASLAINNTVIDDNLYAPVGGALFTKPILTSPDNLFYASDKGTPLLNAPSLEVMKYYEPGSVINEYVKPYFPSVAQAFTITGVTGAKLFYATVPYAVNTAGLTTSDTYLIKAECLARTQDVQGAMGIINMMRRKRIVNSTDLTATSVEQAMALLMRFSRIEFLYTFKNYFNIKRWNTENAYKQTITRTVNGVTYQLKPESPLWIFPFPQSGTNYNTNLTQNY